MDAYYFSFTNKSKKYCADFFIAGVFKFHSVLTLILSYFIFPAMCSVLLLNLTTKKGLWPCFQLYKSRWKGGGEVL